MLPVEGYVPQMPSELDDGVTLDRRGVPVPWEASVACPVAGAEESGGDVHSSSDSSDSEDSSEADTAVDAEIQAPLPEGGTREPATLGGDGSREVAIPGQEERDGKDADDHGKDEDDAADDVPEFNRSYSRLRPMKRHIC